MAAAQSGGCESAGPAGWTNPITGPSRPWRAGPPGRARPPALPKPVPGAAAGQHRLRGAPEGAQPCSASAGCRRRGSSSPFASGGWCRAGRPQVARAEGRGAGSCVPFPDPAVRWWFLLTSEVPQQSRKKHPRGLTQIRYPGLCCRRRLCPFPPSLTPSPLSCRNR